MSRRLQVLVSEELDAKVRKAARRAGVSAGEWVRRAMAEALGRPAGSGRPADPLLRLAALGAPTADVDDMIAQIESGRS